MSNIKKSRIREKYGMLRWVFKEVWTASAGWYIMCAIVALLEFLLPTLASYSYKWFIQSISLKGELRLVVIALVLYLAFKLLLSLFGYISSWFYHRFIFDLNYAFSSKLINKMSKVKQSSMYESDFQDRMKKAVTGYNVIPFFIFSINSAFLSLVVMLFIQIPILLKYTVVFVGVLVVDGILSLVSSRKLSVLQFETENAITRDLRKTSYYENVLIQKNTSKEMRIYGMTPFLLKKWKDAFIHSSESKKKFELRKQGFRMMDDVVSFVIQILILSYLFYSLTKKTIAVEDFVFLITFYPAVSKQFRELLQTSLGDMNAMRLQIQQYIDFLNDTSCDYQNGNNQFSDPLNEITAEGISFKYPGQTKNAIENISIDIKKGEVLAILGYNGSGKSTLSKLITGLLEPNNGTILYNGTDRLNYDSGNLSQLFGIAYQDFDKYSLSIKDNVGFGYIEEYTDNNVKDALKMAKIQGWVDELPEKENTLAGKNIYKTGFEFSGGEWQRLSLARCYMGNHEILLLDEPTASIDPLTEVQMLDNLREILQGRTAVLISHRIGFARLADRIILMDQGHIVEEGTHEELLKSKGLYYTLFEAQSNLYI